MVSKRFPDALSTHLLLINSWVGPILTLFSGRVAVTILNSPLFILPLFLA